MSVKNYRELIVWQKSMDLVEMTYPATRSCPKADRPGRGATDGRHDTERSARLNRRPHLNTRALGDAAIGGHRPGPGHCSLR